MGKRFLFLILSIVVVACADGQNEASKWYFGNKAALDFLTTPPTVVTTSTMNVLEGCSSVADGAGNLLFYTNGTTVWNRTNNVMLNGSLLQGSSGAQSCVSFLKPGSSTQYYIFTTGQSSGLKYSVVDMGLAAGDGSVIAKNQPVNSVQYPDKMVAARHCNGIDVWVITRKGWDMLLSNNQTTSFEAYLVTSAGVNVSPVSSPASSWPWGNFVNGDWGCMKVSPNGRKLAVAVQNHLTSGNPSYPTFELYDFDAITGVVSNSLGLNPVVTTVPFSNTNNSYGCEFSPDGSKFYGSVQNGANGAAIIQWDLCAGTNAAIAASQYTVGPPAFYGTMQLAPNGKIYVAKLGQLNLGVINFPDLSGPACGYAFNGQSISPNQSRFGLPNFLSSYLRPSKNLAPATYTINPAISCLTASFSCPSSPTAGCSAATYSFTGFSWVFGDPQSGAANTSTLANPLHTFSSAGTYTVKLLYNSTCGADTAITIVNTGGANPSISLSGNCAGPNSATVNVIGGTGGYSYLWTPSAQTSSIAYGLAPGNYSVTLISNIGNCAITGVVNVPVTPTFSGTVNAYNTLCFGAQTATAGITVTGGSGSFNYSWTNGLLTQTAAIATGLGAGVYTVFVNDPITLCSLTNTFAISQLPAITVFLSANAATACVGSFVTINTWVSGGTPGLFPPYTYNWSDGTQASATFASSSQPGTYPYTVVITDGIGCAASQSVSVTFIPKPVVNVSSATICPQQTATLTATGATNYVWSIPAATGSNAYASPSITTVYAVTGYFQNCLSAVKVFTVFVKSPPSPTISGNSLLCVGGNLYLSGSGGSSYYWNGPGGFSSASQSPVISSVIPGNSGVYTLTVTGVNSCSATATMSVVVQPSPTLAASGSTVCVTQNLNLFSSAAPGSIYAWSGPNNFSSNLQNPSISNASLSAGGFYSLTVTNNISCSSSITVNAVVVAKPIPIISLNAEGICEGSNLLLSGSGGLTYTWTGPNNFFSQQALSAINNISTAASGSYSLSVTNGPCVNQTARTVTVYPKPTPSAWCAPVCEKNTLHLNSSVGGGNTLAWAGPDGFTSTAQNPVITNVAPVNAGNYTLSVISPDYCISSAVTTATVLMNPFIFTTDQKICLGSTATLVAAGALTYTWSGPGGFSAVSATANISAATSLATMLYSVTGTAANSCTAGNFAAVTVAESPVASLTVTPKACFNSTISLFGSGGNEYEWKGPNNFYSVNKDEHLTLTNYACGGNYTLTVTNSYGCKNQATASVKVDPAPEVVLTGDQPKHCVPYCTTIGFKQVNEPRIIDNLWQTASQSHTATTFQFCAQTAGTQVIKGIFTNLLGCVSEQTFGIAADPKPVADFYYYPERPVEGSDEVLFYNNSISEKPDQLSWIIRDYSTSKAGGENPSHIFSNAGIYPVSLAVKNKWGCSDTVIKWVSVESDFDLFVPNAFTPNGDGKNEVFAARGRGIAKYKLLIFDRWGENVFETSDFSRGWDGTYLGKECQTAVYAWKISFSDATGRSKDLGGHVTLYR